ncbi:hypothetical protein BGZ95_006033 [Linnemannia exigua]|uniref:FAD-binding domain-containing protein n=1 Tax=Linnemannia exigua TaxID=604196 RepID=A0AAD4DLL9_9FUNG|nr:hypothetical protein BGZ95_006033 [Linnemannia exigua]
MSATGVKVSPTAAGYSQTSFANTSAPGVIIIGAGLAGLFLGSYLEEAGIPYDIYERAPEIKPLGAVMCLSPNILPAFEQLSIYEELMSFSKPALESTFYSGDLKVIGRLETYTADSVGYDRILFARPKLYELLFKRIPPHKIHMCKKMMSFDQDYEGVRVLFEDGTVAQGDVLVGADGAHSSVRKHLYTSLENQGLLPKDDTKSMGKGYVSLLGTTDPLDPARYPAMNKPDSDTSFIIGDKSTPYTWVIFTVPGNMICWNVVIQLGLDPVADELAGTSDWVVQDNNQKLMDSIRHFKTPYGVLGDLLDATPIEHVSKVYFEDKLFQTWNHDRTVLIGDAAHKMLPSTGAGAVNAMQDAVILANCLYDIIPTNLDTVKTALEEYKNQRFKDIEDQYAQTYFNAKLQYGHTLVERFLRHVVFNWLPNSKLIDQMQKESAFRPQANFMPQAPRRGTVPVVPQKPSKRMQMEEELEE